MLQLFHLMEGGGKIDPFTSFRKLKVHPVTAWEEKTQSTLHVQDLKGCPALFVTFGDGPEGTDKEEKKVESLDEISQWIKDKCETGEGRKIQSSIAYSSFKEWFQTKNPKERMLASNKFCPRLEGKGFKKRKESGGLFFYYGLSLASSPSSKGDKEAQEEKNRQDRLKQEEEGKKKERKEKETADALKAQEDRKKKQEEERKAAGRAREQTDQNIRGILNTFEQLDTAGDRPELDTGLLEETSADESSPSSPASPSSSSSTTSSSSSASSPSSSPPTASTPTPVATATRTVHRRLSIPRRRTHLPATPSIVTSVERKENEKEDNQPIKRKGDGDDEEDNKRGRKKLRSDDASSITLYMKDALDKSDKDDELWTKIKKAFKTRGQREEMIGHWLDRQEIPKEGITLIALLEIWQSKAADHGMEEGSPAAFRRAIDKCAKYVRSRNKRGNAIVVAAVYK